MNVSDSFINNILKKMGVEPDKPPRWKPHYYISKADPPMGGKRQDGWFCSCCGKHSYTRKNVCDGCDSTMKNIEGYEDSSSVELKSKQK